MVKNKPMFVENFDVVILVNIYTIVSIFNIELKDTYISRMLTAIAIEDYLEREGYVVKRRYTVSDNELSNYGVKINNMVKSIRDNHFYQIVDKYFPKVDIDKFDITVNILSDKHMELRIANETKFSS